MKVLLPRPVALWLSLTATLSLLAQAPDRPPGGPGFGGPPPGFGPGPGGPGGPGQDIRLVDRFDKDGDKRLNAGERQAARQAVVQERANRPGRRGPGGPGGGRGFGPGGPSEPPGPGPRVSPADVRTYPDAPLYEPTTLRTFFLEFAAADWEKELGDFANTDVEVPAKLTVDGKTYADVGVHFRGASSLFTVGEGSKRSLNLSLDYIHEDQNLAGHRTLNLLNSHVDPSFLRTVLYYEICRAYLPAPRANFVRVVINGESWGVYVSAEQFNKDFVRDNFKTIKGARWKVPGSPRGRGGLEYLGDDVAAYRGIYELKTKDKPEAWNALVALCKTLNETPADKLEAALAPLLDIDGALKFLALENVLVNNDGYWIRASDYNLYLDADGRFHVIPHDANETFSYPGGPGFGGRGGGPGGPGGGGNRVEGVKLDPLLGANDDAKPLLSKLLAVPALKARYLGYVRNLAENWLDWEKKLGPLARKYHDLIAPEVARDTRKLATTEAFAQSLEGATTPAGEGGGFRGPRSISLKQFADERRAYLLAHPEVKAARN